MTAELLYPSTVGAWFSGLPKPGITIALRAGQQDQSTTTLSQATEYAERAAAVWRIVELVQRTPNIQPQAVVRLLDWLSGVPIGMPQPFIAVADDGSISSEWDARGQSLHVTFFDGADEVYFCNPEGEEWEGTVDAVDKLSQAMHSITRAARE